MGIIHLQPQKYKCSKCGGEGHKYSRSAKPERPGTYEGIKCDECDHYTETYKQSIQELEMGSNSWSRNPNRPIPF